MIGFDYYPFGMQMPERTKATGNYRYGFNGKENNQDMSSDGLPQDYGMRIYEGRLGRFLSVDPLSQEYPWYTPYQFAGNKPIQFIDLDGLEELDVAINGYPNGSDKPGRAKLTISLDYQVVTAGFGAVGAHGSRINPTTIQNNFAQGNTNFRMSQLPTSSASSKILNNKQNRWARKAEAGNKRTLAKLQRRNIQYFNVAVVYNVTVSNVPNKDLQSIMPTVDANPHRNGVIMDPIPNQSPGWGNGSYMHGDINTLAVHANSEFARYQAAGTPAEGYGSTFQLINKEANIIIFNPANITIGVNKVITHESGHNMTNLGHGNGSYEYNQQGLQSNQPGSIYPTKQNTEAIINDQSNRSTIKTKPPGTP